MRKTVIWVAVLALALGLSAGFYFNRSQEVQTSTAVSHEFTTFIEGAGAVGAPTEVVLVPSNGLVKSMPVKVGQHVSAGDVVLRMDDETLQLQLEEAVLALNAQKKSYQRQNGDLTRSEQETAMVAAQTSGYGLEQFN
jgi:multidrug efflux pump subunit AcrA (membrane-fusion protein)